MSFFHSNVASFGLLPAVGAFHIVFTLRRPCAVFVYTVHVPSVTAGLAALRLRFALGAMSVRVIHAEGPKETARV